MRRSIPIVGLILLSTILSCENSGEPEQLNCDNFAEGIIRQDQDILSKEISKLVTDLEPNLSTDDKFGHKNNLPLLVERINSQCSNIESEIICYACIETNPPQSEIKVSTDSSVIQISRIIDILTSSEKNLTFIRIHN